MEPYILAAKEHPRAHPSSLEPDERRRQYREQAGWLWPAPESVSSVSDVEIPLAGRVVKARLYVPFDEDPRAVILYVHGGSFVAGDLDTHDGLCRRLAADTKMRYLSIEYRLAPEHPFPAGLDDVREAIVAVARDRALYGADRAALVVMGDSAGATLVTVALTQLRRESVDVAAQVLLYPTMGPSLLTDSSHVYRSGFLLDVDHLRYDYGQYVGDGVDPSDERVSPLLSRDLVGVPPAIIVVAECDPLRDEAVAYAGLLEHFGVTVELLEAHGMLHGFLRLGGLVPEALAIVDDLALHLERLVHEPT
jgi:acetyl esterase/lipase